MQNARPGWHPLNLELEIELSLRAVFEKSGAQFVGGSVQDLVSQYPNYQFMQQ